MVSFKKGNSLLYVTLLLFDLYVIILFKLEVILNKSFSYEFFTDFERLLSSLYFFLKIFLFISIVSCFIN